MKLILKKVEEYCSQVLGTIKVNLLPFHNIHHTRAVVSHVMEIGSHIAHPDLNIELVKVAAWFHDIGHVKKYENHEDASAEMALDFLTKENLDTHSIKVIQSCIQATRLNQKPASISAKILCDADLYHLSSLDYFYWQLLLRREWEIVLKKTYSDKEWYELNSQFLSHHNYHTDYGKNVLFPRVSYNQKKMDRLLSIYK